MLIYEECFNTAQIAHACLRRIFQCGRVYLHFTYNDIYICYSSYFTISPERFDHLALIKKKDTNLRKSISGEERL